MNPTARRLAVLLLAALFAPGVHAQTPLPEGEGLPAPSYYKPLRFEKLTQAEGLSQTTVVAIHQDRRGYLWFGVEGGLNRYDGYAFKHFTTIPFDSTSILSGRVNTIYEDGDGTMWVGLQGGLVRYDPGTETFERFEPVQDENDSTSVGSGIHAVLEDREGRLWVGGRAGLRRMDDARTGVFTTYRHDPDDEHSLSDNRIEVLHEDAEGRLWIGTWGGGLNRMDLDAPGRFTRFLQREGDNWKRATVFSILPDPLRSDRLWVGTADGLFAFDTQTEEITPYLRDLSSGPIPVSGITRDPEVPHLLWVATGYPQFEGGVGLVRLDTRTGEVRRYAHNPTDPYSLPNDNLFSIYADRSGVVWAGAQMVGLMRFNPSPGGFIHYRHIPDDPKTLPLGGAWDIAEDQQGRLWTLISPGDVRGGGHLARIDRETGEVTRFRHDPRDPASISNGILQNLYIDRRGYVWAAVRGGGLERIDPRTDRVRHFRPSDRPGALPPGNVGGFTSRTAEDHRGSLWFSVFGSRPALVRFDPETERFTTYRHAPDDSTTLTPGIAFATLIGHDGLIWAGTPGGLNRLDPETGRVTRFLKSPGDTTQSANGFLPLYQDVQRRLWGPAFDALSTPELSLAAFDPASETFTLYQHEPADPTSFHPAFPRYFVERGREPGILWIATWQGLMRLDTETGVFRHYTKYDGLVDNHLYSLLEDDRGRLWMSSNGGIFVFTPENDTFRQFGVRDGLQATEFDASSAHKSARTGEMFFGGIDGITAFFPDQVVNNPVPPAVHLTGLRLFNEPVHPTPDGPLRAPLSEADEIRLEHWQKSIAFDFIGLHFKNPEKNTYRYRLEGFDDDWVEAGTQRSAAYTNLDPGTYTFRVTAANSDGVWNEEGAAIRMMILPPWWATPWAYLLYGVIGLGLVVGGAGVQRRRIQHRERQRAAVAQAELRAEAAESEAKALQAENQRKQNLERLSEIGRDLTASLDLETIFHRLYEHVNALVDAPIFGVGLYRPEDEALDFRLAIADGKRYAPYTRSTTDKNQLAVWCVEHREPIFINDVEKEHGRYIAHYDAKSRTLEDGSIAATPSAMLYLPLVNQGRALGVISIQSYRTGAYTEDDLHILGSLAAYTAIALDNAFAYRRLDETLSHLQTTQQQLVQQEKLASLGALTAGIAHEIKNPLNFINNFSSLSTELVDELREALGQGDADEIEALLFDIRLNAEKISEHGRRADGIVRSMMAHARGGKSTRETVDLNAFVAEYVDLAFHGKRAQTSDFNAAIEKDLDARAGVVELMPQEMGRVLLNLLSNAFDAVHEHASRTNGQYMPAVRVATHREDGQVVIRVEDNGDGIPPEVRDKIFEPFFTTKPTGQGTGLGLSLSYDIVTQGHGGMLTVESERGKGAAFVITLPASVETPALAP